MTTTDWRSRGQGTALSALTPPERDAVATWSLKYGHCVVTEDPKPKAASEAGPRYLPVLEGCLSRADVSRCLFLKKLVERGDVTK